MCGYRENGDNDISASLLQRPRRTFPLRMNRIPERLADASARENKFVIFVTNVALLSNDSKTKCRHARTNARKRFFPKIVTGICRVKEMGLCVPLGFAFPPFIPASFVSDRSLGTHSIHVMRSSSTSKGYPVRFVDQCEERVRRKGIQQQQCEDRKCQKHVLYCCTVYNTIDPSSCFS